MENCNYIAIDWEYEYFQRRKFELYFSKNIQQGVYHALNENSIRQTF